MPSLGFRFTPEVSSPEGMEFSLDMPAKRSTKFSVSGSAMLLNLCHELYTKDILIIVARGMHLLQEKKASVAKQNKSLDTIMTVTLTKCCGSR